MEEMIELFNGGLENVSGQSVEGFALADLSYLSATEGLNAGAWESLSLNERCSQLNILEGKLAEIQGRPPCRLVVEKMPRLENCGYFDGKSIHINIEHLKNADYRLEVIDTIAHEGRHAYQQYAIENLGFHPNEKETLYWAANRQSYLSPTDAVGKLGFEFYANQPMELDADMYASQVKSLFCKTDLSVNSYEANNPMQTSSLLEKDKISSFLISNFTNMGNEILSRSDVIKHILIGLAKNH